jgi:hypothetical protein
MRHFRIAWFHINDTKNQIEYFPYQYDPRNQYTIQIAAVNLPVTGTNQ